MKRAQIKEMKDEPSQTAILKNFNIKKYYSPIKTNDDEK